MKIIFMILCFIAILQAAPENRAFDMNRLRQEVGDELPSDSAPLLTKDADKAPVGLIVFRIVGSLLILSFLVVLVVWLIRKSGIIQGANPQSKGSFEVLESLTTGQGSALLMVRFEQSVLLLGQTPSQINLLKSYDGEEAVKLIYDKREGETVAGFQKSLDTFISGLKQGERAL